MLRMGLELGFDLLRPQRSGADLLFCRPERGMGRRTCSGASGEFARTSRRVPCRAAMSANLVLTLILFFRPQRSGADFLRAGGKQTNASNEQRSMTMQGDYL